jgi:ribosomal protein L7/L12
MFRRRLLPVLRIVGWTKGLQTVSLIKAVRAATGVGLKDAMALVDGLMTGGEIEIQFRNKDDMIKFFEDASSLGAQSIIIDEP